VGKNGPLEGRQSRIAAGFSKKKRRKTLTGRKKKTLGAGKAVGASQKDHIWTEETHRRSNAATVKEEKGSQTSEAQMWTTLRGP